MDHSTENGKNLNSEMENPSVENAAPPCLFTWDGEERSCIPGQSLEDLLGASEKFKEDPTILAKINGRIRELHYQPQEGDTITSLPLSSSEGNMAYERGLLHTLIRASRAVLPGCHVVVEHSILSGLYCEIEASTPLTPFDVDRIGRKMREMVDADGPFVRRLMDKEDAIRLYESSGQTEKSRLLAVREDHQFKVYESGGYSDYFYGYMPPSTGYLQRFRLVYEMPGLVLLLPRPYRMEMPNSFDTPRKLLHVFRESERWGRILNCRTVADLNELASDEEKLQEFILINEARHDAELYEIARQIEASKARLVLIAGPSSSGKTTFTQKLRLQLRMRGKNPVMLSLDNYYLDRHILPVQEDGSVDLENINTLDLPLLNQHLSELLQGMEVSIPRFDFEVARRDHERCVPMRLETDDILLVEGIHGLNESLTAAIPGNEKFKIYISALTQLNLDNHNRIPTTDVRLLRRMVRDYASRNTSAEATLAMWPSVRAGEEAWIFPFQERADVMFNSTLVYELLYLKQDAYPLLRKITVESPQYSEAVRLLRFLKYFVNPPEGSVSLIPNTSLLREFIGGGVFER